MTTRRLTGLAELAVAAVVVGLPRELVVRRVPRVPLAQRGVVARAVQLARRAQRVRRAQPVRRAQRGAPVAASSMPAPMPRMLRERPSEMSVQSVGVSSRPPRCSPEWFPGLFLTMIPTVAAGRSRHARYPCSPRSR